MNLNNTDYKLTMYKKYIIGLFTLCCAGNAAAQSLAQAKQLFLNGEFEQAKPAFQKLVKQAPSNANYNYWYGACCYETGEKKEAQPYLEKSAARKVIDAYRYLGKLYYDIYRFDDAVDNYEQHIEWLEKKKRPTEMAEAELEQIKQAARMIKGVENITVIDSFVVDKNDFLKAYKISRESGALYHDPAISGTVYQTEMGNKVLYGNQSTDGKMQLYSRIRLLDGWSEPEPLTSLNEQGNVNYPFLMSDGITLYYASDGEGSLGGYDIFVTRYDSENSNYLRPDNIGMPFNSPPPMTICMPLMNSTISAGLLQTAISLITKSVSMCLYRTLQKKYTIMKVQTNRSSQMQPACALSVLLGKMKRKYEPASNAWQP